MAYGIELKNDELIVTDTLAFVFITERLTYDDSALILIHHPTLDPSERDYSVYENLILQAIDKGCRRQGNITQGPLPNPTLIHRLNEKIKSKVSGSVPDVVFLFTSTESRTLSREVSISFLKVIITLLPRFFAINILRTSTVEDFVSKLIPGIFPSSKMKRYISEAHAEMLARTNRKVVAA